MPTKITIIIDDPTDPVAFETAYADIRKAAEGFPELRRVESAKVWPKEDGSPTPAYRTLDLSFDSYEDASAAVATPVAAAVFGGLAGTGTTFTGLFSDIEYPGASDPRQRCGSAARTGSAAQLVRSRIDSRFRVSRHNLSTFRAHPR